MSEWKPIPLKELTNKIGSGATPKGGGESYKDFGISLIRSQNVLEIMFSKAGLAFIDEEQAHDLRNVTVEPLDVLLNITGDSVARCCMVPSYTLPARVNQHVCIIRADKCKLVPSFLMYCLNYHKEDLLSLSEIGATRRALTKAMVEDFQINLPPLQEQESIAEVLSSLDDKIDLLHRQNQTLEQLAETMFRQWFVEETDDSWEEATLEEYVHVVSGYSYRSDDLNPSTTALVTLKNFERTGGFRIDGFKEYTGRFKQDQLVTEGDLIVAHTDITQEAEVLGNPAIVIGTPKYSALVISTDLVKVVPKSYISKCFLYYLMKSDDFKHYCLGCSNGTTVLHLSKKAIPNYEFKVPPKEKIEKFTNTVTPILMKTQMNHNQLVSLEQTRDTLLPKLMSGAVRVVSS